MAHSTPWEHRALCFLGLLLVWVIFDRFLVYDINVSKQYSFCFKQFSF